VVEGRPARKIDSGIGVSEPVLWALSMKIEK